MVHPHNVKFCDSHTWWMKSLYTAMKRELELFPDTTGSNNHNFLATSNNRNVFCYGSRGFRSKSGVPRAVLSGGSAMSLLTPFCQHVLAANKAWQEGHYSSLPSILAPSFLWISLPCGSVPSFPPFFSEGYVREFLAPSREFQILYPESLSHLFGKAPLF